MERICVLINIYRQTKARAWTSCVVLSRGKKRRPIYEQRDKDLTGANK